MRIPFPAVGLSLVFTAAAHAASPLAEQPSAFLRAHADSPVQWMLWGEAAFARAKAEKKPVYLAIGAFTSELSRAMRTQSFAREENAAMLNENFVCVLVDRDDEPALAALAQHYLNVVKQAQGWPLNLWLTPELKPFEGASYLPPSDEWGKEGFANATKRVLTAWQSDPEAQRQKADEAVAAQLAAAPGTPPEVSADIIKQLLAENTTGWMALYDATNGGFGDPPRYPQPELLRFLLQHDDAGRETAMKTLRAIATSPLRDPLDGGFFRYASDAEWKLPYFQKTLIDQARLALAFLDAERRQPDPLWPEAVRGALDYALSLKTSSGAYSAAEDGTPENLAPSFMWTHDEVKAALGSDEAAVAAFGVTAAGNLAADAYLGVETAGKNLLQPAGAVHADAAAKLLAIRQARPVPLRDDVATAGAHALLATAFARAGAELKDARFTAAAKELNDLVREKLLTTAGSLRCRPGRDTLASPRDHALVAGQFLQKLGGTEDIAVAAGTITQMLALVRVHTDEAGTGRLWSAPEPLPPGLWARVHVPPPDNADLPGAESALLLAFVDQGIDAARLAAAIAQDISDSPTVARGDQLLALHIYAQRN